MNIPTFTPSIPAIADTARVRVGAGLKRRPVLAPVKVGDAGKVRVGAGLKLPTSVVDAGRVRVGAGLKRR